MNELAFTLVILVAASGNNDYETRENATQLLTEIGAFSQAHSLYFSKNANDPEIRYRCHNSLFCLTENYLIYSAWTKPFPWID